ncbi:MAG TPA: PadR family transcriptional regulator [Chloroflexota bacterium]
MFKHFGGRRGPFGPPHGHHHHGHGGHGHGGPWGQGPFGGFGPHRKERRFGRGDLKYVILDLLKDGPRHGYDVIRAMEDRFGGFYSPSPGSVYPILQLLEDQGYVTSSQQDGKRIYTITDEGRAFLAERADVVEGLRKHMDGPWSAQLTPEVRQLVQELWQLGQLVIRQGAHGGLGDPDKVRRLRDVVARARIEVEGIFSGSSSSGSSSGSDGVTV